MSKVVKAAGAALCRRTSAGTEIAVVHRPHYDDWSLPKGKLDPGETSPVAAVREVAEETGFDAALGQFLTTVEYDVHGAPKKVDYFTAQTVSGEFTPNEEVDELRWLPLQEARSLLTYPSDRDVCDLAGRLPSDTATVLLVRHAKAGKREDWAGDDDLRPLSDAGIRQAEALRPLLGAFRPEQVYSAPRLRCVQTVRAVADDIDGEVQIEPSISEEEYSKNPEIGIKWLLFVAASHTSSVVCSQGGVIPDLLDTLAQRHGVELPRKRTGEVPSKKGSVWVLSFDTTNDTPRLVAAHYLPTALPEPC
ncbi:MULTISPECIES: NUDIX hydrolase [Saccharomonospora]|uniref:NTP pyrophosphohydrolase n=2 Tax=Saccharomonospora viridis TaxID=1852 RepID=C7MXF8_SACVD|nr:MULTISPECIES: NUDIX hydrolase [Saccharomonospora]ACU95967.1 NTP pyrophosphohydrolase [Saccharomonospora viridis DSM 43017]KHF45537.1 NUDIX hydrolase [Saccharomonospora viridis]SFP74580.1 8-oxo-dGTP diphosphatase [Saccharomonospora viridis]